ncbi:hypothetical protein J1605_018572 [Eschrichtius robustus]|uniref:Uncharacterized protein n=1 Tax=Eschrichtius robustus TaxID=9764 RepID=A0AB34HVI6_ESCRO|nr:hypothetical protein J1605_018572 [Eschrichtius robustus]
MAALNKPGLANPENWAKLGLWTLLISRCRAGLPGLPSASGPSPLRSFTSPGYSRTNWSSRPSGTKGREATSGPRLGELPSLSFRSPGIGPRRHARPQALLSPDTPQFCSDLGIRHETECQVVVENLGDIKKPGDLGLRPASVGHVSRSPGGGRRQESSGHQLLPARPGFRTAGPGVAGGPARALDL